MGKETKRTPGPWEYDKRMGVGTTVDGSRISTWINTPSWGDGGINVIFRNGLEFTKAEANASLIAAAPELLEVVLGIVKWWQEGNAHLSPDALLLAGDDTIKEAASRAASKATGEES
jgi:hypothetical protein